MHFGDGYYMPNAGSVEHEIGQCLETTTDQFFKSVLKIPSLIGSETVKVTDISRHSVSITN
jgi:hypothetical protein